MVAEKLCIKPEAIDKLPNFPKKIKLSDSKQSRVRYRQEEVDAWITSREES